AGHQRRLGVSDRAEDMVGDALDGRHATATGGGRARVHHRTFRQHRVFFFSSRRRHTRSVSAFLLNRSSDLTSKEAKMGKVMRHTLGASLNIRHNLSSSKGPKPLQLKLLTTYIPKTSAFTLAFSTSQRLRTTRASARTFFTFRHY